MNPSDLPLLEADDVRIDVGGAVALERATFVTEGGSLVISGETTALMSALAGVEPVRAGQLLLRGRDVGQREHLEIVGLAPLDPPLPPKWTALDYLAWSARLVGAPKSTARRLASDALGTLAATSLSETRLDALGIAERRVLVLAHAIVTAPKVLIAAMPLAGLSGAAAEYVLRAFERATRDRAWIASVTRLDAASPEYALVAKAEGFLRFGAGRLLQTEKLARGSQGATGYFLSVGAHAERLRSLLAMQGIELQGGPAQFWVRLPEGASTDAILAASIEAEAPIVQLSPFEE